ncbi:unnamed protein product [Owenia fusiformis]|uniref:RING finger protein 207 n=1 Tax=Owenia fusiformis TaxID=6347 RepID=A0A8S4MVU2_OWEFU|nr:unnamed protein product [Owenia fusiformis]
MSGGIFHPPSSSNAIKQDPLCCLLCNEQYDQPCLLQCYHSFCSNCLRGRSQDGLMLCPMCGAETVLQGDDTTLPPTDSLVTFLLSTTAQKNASCANCEEEHEDMFYCNTCAQPLCEQCRTETHRARMFALHEVVPLGKRTKDIQRHCDRHGQPFIMFSTETKEMLCINCFRDTSVSSRANCIDLESAYNEGCEKLDHEVLAMKELQNAVQDAIVLVKVLLDEIEQNADTEKSAINELYDKIQEKVAATRKTLLQQVDNQYKEKDKIFKEQLCQLSALLPTLHVHLAMASSFSSSANKFEFLELGYVLMSRLSALTHADNPIQPRHTSLISTDHKLEYSKQDKGGMSGASNTLQGGATSSLHYTNGNGRRMNSNGHKVKFIEANTLFADHCKEFEANHRDILQKFELLKVRVQDAQRDMTLRRCLARPQHLKDISEKCDTIEEQANQELEHLQQKHSILEKHWDESCTRIAIEQEIYQAQVNDLVRVKKENEKVATIVRQLQPFISSIGTVTERISPKLGETNRSLKHDNEIQSLFEQINTMSPDSQQRIEAIASVQEERQTQIANKTNPLDDALIKTKGMLKSPSIRDTGPRKDRDSISSDKAKDIEAIIEDPTNSEELNQVDALLKDIRDSVSRKDRDLINSDNQPKNTGTLTKEHIPSEESINTVDTQVGKDSGVSEKSKVIDSLAEEGAKLSEEHVNSSIACLQIAVNHEITTRSGDHLQGGLLEPIDHKSIQNQNVCRDDQKHEK